MAETKPRATPQVMRGPLIPVLGACCLGILADVHASVSVTGWCAAIGLSLLVWFLLARGRRWIAASLVLLAAAGSLAGLWHHHRWSLYQGDQIARFASDVAQPMCLRLVAVDSARISPPPVPTPLSTMSRGDTTRVVVWVEAVRDGSVWRSASGATTLIVHGQLTGVHRGDRLRVVAMVKRTRPPGNPGEPDFAAMRRRRRQLVVLHCEHPCCVVRLSSGGWISPMRAVGRFRTWSEGVLRRQLGRRQAPLAAALLLGNREGLDQRVVDAFFVSGTLHLLAISGLHVGILASLFWLLIRLAWFPRPLMLWITVTLAVGYALLTGARPPVVRATSLILVFALARGAGRPVARWNSLAAAALLTLALCPDGLRDTGTQLSFLAVATLVAWWSRQRDRGPTDPLDQLVAQSRPIWHRAMRGMGTWTWRIIRMSAVVWLFSAPLVACRFHLVTPVGLALNLVLWFPVTVALFAGLGTLGAAALAPPLADPFGGVCSSALSTLTMLTGGAASVPWGHVWVAGPPEWWLWGFYGGCLMSLHHPLVLPRRWWAGLLIAWITAGLLGSGGGRLPEDPARDTPLRIFFADVGHGTSVLLEFPNGQSLMYDAGSMRGPRPAALSISSLLWSRRKSHVGAIVLSHADVDHFNAVPELLSRFSIGAVYVSAAMARSDAPAVKTLYRAIMSAGVPIRIVGEGDELAGDARVRVRVLHPPETGVDRSDNANSVVLTVDYAGYRVLLPGDLAAEGLDELLAEMPLACTVVMAPHHGSPHSRPAALLRWANPACVIISGGAERDGIQRPDSFSEWTGTVLCTHQHGAIRLDIDTRGVRVRCQRGIATLADRPAASK